MGVKLLIVSFSALILPLLLTLSAESGPVIFLSPADTTVACRTSFELLVVADADVTDLMGYDITVEYDPLVLSVQSANEGNLLLDCGHPTFFCWLNRGSEDGSVLVNGVVLGATVEGPGALFTMSFIARGGGQCIVRISASELRSNSNSSIDHVVQHGTVYVSGPTSVERKTWGAVKKKF